MATIPLKIPTSASAPVDAGTPFVGTTANDSTGTTIRESFTRINARLGEIYGSQNSSNVVQTPFIDGDNIKNDAVDSQHYAAGSIDEEHLQISNDPSSNQILKWDGSTGFTWVDQFDGDITSIVAGNGLTGSSLDTDDATLNVIGGDGITSTTDEIEVTVDDSTIELSASDGTGSVRVKDLGITTAKIANDGVTHDKLEARFTESKTDYTSPLTADPTTVDWSVAAVHQITLGDAVQLNFSNFKKGQAIDLIITGNYTLTFGLASGSPTFNRVGSNEYDGSSTNLIQIICTDDATNGVFYYAIGTYQPDPTP